MPPTVKESIGVTTRNPDAFQDDGLGGFTRLRAGSGVVALRAQSLTRMLCHILPQLLDGQLRTMDVARLGEASRERIGLRRRWRWNRLPFALFIYHLSELTISVQIVKLYPVLLSFFFCQPFHGGRSG